MSNTDGPVVPVGPTVDTLEQYYRSIEEPFSETRRLRQAEEESEFLNGVAFIPFVFSLIPLIPYLLYRFCFGTASRNG